MEGGSNGCANGAARGCRRVCMRVLRVAMASRIANTGAVGALLSATCLSVILCLSPLPPSLPPLLLLSVHSPL
jgi:hypothetical protein